MHCAFLHTRFVLLGLFLTLFSVSTGTSVYALDEARIASTLPKEDARRQVQFEIIATLLETTSESYGDFAVNEVGRLPAMRIVPSLEDGTINVMLGSYDKSYTDRFYALPIPFDENFLDYRLLLTTRDRLLAFSSLSDAEQWRSMKVGLMRGWLVKKFFEDAGYEVLFAKNADNLYSMLKAGRFDFVPLGIYAYQHELKRFAEKHPDLVIVPGVKFYIKTPIYVYVNRKHSRLAARLGSALESDDMREKLDALMRSAFKPALDAAELHRRITISVEPRGDG